MDLQLGKETNWLAVAGTAQKIVTLKDDGTLWLWNFYHDNHRGWDPERDEREMLDVKPVRLGTHADWIAIAAADGGIISLAADGSLWYWPLEDDFRIIMAPTTITTRANQISSRCWTFPASRNSSAMFSASQIENVASALCADFEPQARRYNFNAGPSRGAFARRARGVSRRPRAAAAARA